MAKSALGPALLTVVVAVLELLPGVGSVVPLEASATDAVLLSELGAPACTFRVTVTVALAPAFRAPRLQTSGFGAPQDPWLGVALLNVTFAPRGNGSVTRACDASAGPLLLTVGVSGRMPGAVTGSRASVVRMLGFACGGCAAITMVFSVEELLEGSGSATLLLTVAVLVRVPGCAGTCTMMVTVACAPEARLGKVHVTGGPCMQAPPA